MRKMNFFNHDRLKDEITLEEGFEKFINYKIALSKADETIKFYTQRFVNFSKYIKEETEIKHIHEVLEDDVIGYIWKDIFWETSQVRIIKTITNKTVGFNENGYRIKITNTKNRKNRTIKIPLILKNMLLELYDYYNEYEGFNDSWFVFGGYRHLPSQTIDNHKDHYFELAKETYGVNVNRITNHEFRHPYVKQKLKKYLLRFCYSTSFPYGQSRSLFILRQNPQPSNQSQPDCRDIHKPYQSVSP